MKIVGKLQNLSDCATARPTFVCLGFRIHGVGFVRLGFRILCALGLALAHFEHHYVNNSVNAAMQLAYAPTGGRRSGIGWLPKLWKNRSRLCRSRFFALKGTSNVCSIFRNLHASLLLGEKKCEHVSSPKKKNTW